MDRKPLTHNLILDSNGVLLAFFAGKFDVETWIRLRDEIVTRDFPWVNLNDRPVVADISGLIAPDSDWIAHTDSVLRVQEERGIRYGRYALVTGGVQEANIMANFFIQYATSKNKMTGGIKVFINFEDAYAWATSGQPQAPDIPDGTMVC